MPGITPQTLSLVRWVIVESMNEDDPVSAEVRYWLNRNEFGLLSAVARLAGVTPTSVSAWATGAARPREHHWPALEEAFGQRAGHLKRVASGDIAPGETPIEITIPRPTSGEAGTPRVVNQPRGDDLRTVVESLVQAVQEGREMTNATLGELADRVAHLERAVADVTDQRGSRES